MSELYNVVFSGKIGDNHSKAEVVENLKQKMGASDAFIKKMFTGYDVVIKKEVPLAKANAIQKKLLSLGAQTVVEPVVMDEDDFLDEPTTVLALQEKTVSRQTAPTPIVVEEHIHSQQPNVVVIERAVDSTPIPSKLHVILPALTWIFGVACLVAGMLLVVEFEPISERVIKKGLIAGGVLCLLGSTLIKTRHGA